MRACICAREQLRELTHDLVEQLIRTLVSACVWRNRVWQGGVRDKGSRVEDLGSGCTLVHAYGVSESTAVRAHVRNARVECACGTCALTAAGTKEMASPASTAKSRRPAQEVLSEQSGRPGRKAIAGRVLGGRREQVISNLRHFSAVCTSTMDLSAR